MPGKGSSGRIRFDGFTVDTAVETNKTLAVQLTLAGDTYSATCQPGTSPEEHMWAVGRATVDCLNQMFTGASLELLDIQIVQVFTNEAVAVAMATHEAGTEQYAVGFCMKKEGLENAAARAVLNGTNRFTERMTRDA